MNNVNLIGRLTRDVDLRYTPNGNAAASFSIAVERNYTNQQGKRDADFINIIAWRKLAENVANFCSKGSPVGVTGRLETRSYEKDGKKVWVTEVVAQEIKFLSSPKNNENGQPNKGPNQNSKNANPFDRSQPIDISGDDLPF